MRGKSTISLRARMLRAIPLRANCGAVGGKGNTSGPPFAGQQGRATNSKSN
jgi:hypothetical protein